MDRLPQHQNINTSALGNLFVNTHTSYKFVFFQALLLLIKKNLWTQSTFTFNELEGAMLGIADYPINMFKLNFGRDDQIAQKIHNKQKKIDLFRYVPYRLIIPFLDKKITKGLRSPSGNKKIAELSAHKSEYRSIYKINDKSITVYPEWMQYFEQHFAVIEGWVFWHWVNYLQGKNPNAIALVNKLQKPSIRSSLNHQTTYWKTVLKHQELTCIFSQKPIIESDLSLDHFLPWSFIGHDQLWNLIPISKSVNSSKSDNIPSMDKYLDKFIELQIQGLQISNQNMAESKWENQVDDFVTGLNVNFLDLTNNKKVVTEKYQEIILPLAGIAHNMGFSSNWEC
jgi:hypothetical protein